MTSESGTGVPDNEAEAESESESEVGSVAEEAAKLLGALQGWAAESGFGRDAARGLLDGLSSADDHSAHGQDCRWCPICRLVSGVRGTSPEVREHLGAGISALAQAAVAYLRDTGPDPCTDPDTDAGTGPAHGSPRRIDLDE